MKNFIKKISLKTLILSFFTIVLLAFSITDASAQAKDSKGKDFWLMFDGNYDNTPTLTLFITSAVNASGTVSIPGISFSAPFTVTANTVVPVIIPTSVSIHTNDVVDNNGIHVTSDQEITVYGLNQITFTTDAYLGLPTDVLGTDYIVLNYKSGSIGGDVGIVGTADGTTVTITPSATTLSHTAGTPFNITLNQGQTYELENSGDANADLTGTVITSTKPVGVMGAVRCANIPPGASYCDHICEMLPPTTTWGKKFGTVPLKSRTNGDTWRFLASEDNTTVSINGVAQSPINRGQFIETILTTQSIIESDKPILVAEYSNGSSFSGEPGDPFMMLVPPLEQFLPGYTLTTVSGFVSHYINIVAPNAIVGLLTLDGAAVSASEFTPIGSSGFSGAQLTVTDGSHTLLGNLPFGAFQYGFNSDDSYGYPGGQSFSPVATVNSISIMPKTGSGSTNTQTCFTADVKDQFNAAVAGVRVDFNIIGPNASNSGFAVTNSTGTANFCYTAANAGLDSIVATVGTIRDTATFTWASGCDLDLSYKVSDVTCKGSNTGTIDLTVGGGKAPFVYTWSNGASTEDLTGLTAGDYSVTVTDANKCSQSITVKVAEPATALTAASTAGTITCFGNTTTVSVTAMGGQAPYTGTGTFTVGAGDYSYTVKDANGCTATAAGTVTQPASAVSCSIMVSPNPTISGGDMNTIYLGNGPQSVTLTGTGAGGTGEYSYDWGSDGTGNTITVSPTVTTTYTLTVTDANKCTSTCQVTINVVQEENPCDKNPVRCHIKMLPDGSLPGQKENTIYKGYGLQDALLYADVDGGQRPYTYKWSGGHKFIWDPVRLVSPDCTTTYTLCVTDAKGCTSTCSITVKVVDVRCGNKGNKVKLCYRNNMICVNKWEVPYALWWGAKLGDCGWKKSEERIAGNTEEMKVISGITPFIKAYPNPANKYLDVEWNAGENDRSILRVTDMQGRVLISKQYERLLKTGINTTRLQLNGFAKGMYLLQLTGKDGSKTIKFTVE